VSDDITPSPDDAPSGPPDELDAEFAELIDAQQAEEAAAEAIRGDLTDLAAQRDEYLDSLRRLQADFENYRRRVKADMELEVGRATEKLVARLLPVLDTFEMALTHEADPNASPMAKVHDQLLSALESEGLERLWPEGMEFDPVEAEAVMHEPGDGGSPMVSEVMRAGYRWKGRVMRAAMVKVRD
jgi:molecular chaperone GrpE